MKWNEFNKKLPELNTKVIGCDAGGDMEFVVLREVDGDIVISDKSGYDFIPESKYKFWYPHPSLPSNMEKLLINIYI